MYRSKVCASVTKSSHSDRKLSRFSVRLYTCIYMHVLCYVYICMYVCICV